MIQANEKIIMYDSPEAAQEITLTGWMSGDDKRFWYKDEHMARWSGCTHVKCDCGNIMTKCWTKCDTCRSKMDNERYNALPYREWDGMSPVVTRDGDKYFFNEDELIDYCEENEVDTIELLLCVENHYSPIDTDIWADIFPEDSDGEVPKEMQEAIDNLNEVIKRMNPCSYSPGKIRTSYTVATEDAQKTKS